MGAKSLLRSASGALALAMLLPLAAQAEVSVEKKDDGWAVHASKEPMSKVLSELAKQANINVSGTEKLIEDPEISGDWSGDTDTVLARIMRGVDYAAETATDKHGTERIVRVVVLSGQTGKAPSARAVRQARKLPTQPTPEERKQAVAEGKQVTGMLEARARLAAGQKPEMAQDADNPAPSSNPGIKRNADGSYDIDPATQAKMAEATQRAQQNLQALVNSLRRAEQDTQNPPSQPQNTGN